MARGKTAFRLSPYSLSHEHLHPKRKKKMKYGLHVSQCGEYADARLLAELAREAEEAGWDGFFVWDHVSMTPTEPLVDPWVALAAIAMSTEQMRIGTMVTPVARRHPWKLARESVSLDQLSGGRLILGVGLGDSGQEYEQFGQPSDSKTRAAMLDEGLDVLVGLWSGEPFSYAGSYYHVGEVQFTPTSVQRPRIPIWVAGFWPKSGPFRRAARYDGVFPGKLGSEMTPADVRDISAFVDEQRAAGGDFDVAIMDATPGDKLEEAARLVAPFEEAGATWWFEPIHSWRGTLDEMRTRVLQGPPR
jgi:alkanesulfonate monooxygenase SsuD/methylene tetrahydromethanopterin reductase-like flavin-dependent oxidoreductase (luciferase family)